MGRRWPILLLSLVAAGAVAGELRRDYVDADAGQLHVRISGNPALATESKPLLVLLHQVPNSSQVFEKVMPMLGRPAVAFDLPGFGMSDPVEDTIGAYANAILAGIVQLEADRIDLVGYHTGAAVAAEIVQKRPELVRRLVLAAVPVLTRQERDRFAALPPIPFDEEGDFARQEFQRSMHWRGPGQSVDSVKRTFAEKMRPGARERGAAAVVAYDLAAVLPRIDLPTLVLRPRDDLWEATLRARPLLQHAQWVDLPDYGHGLFDVIPERLSELITGFLDQSEN